MNPMNMMKRIRAYFKALEDKRIADHKAYIREEFILTHWEELKVISIRARRYEFMARTSERIAVCNTLEDLNLLLSKNEVRDFQAAIQARIE